MKILIVCVICSGFLILSSCDRVSEPIIYDKSTTDQLILDCVSSTPNVTYTWLGSKGETLSTRQQHIVPRPKEDVTLTCVVDNRVSQQSRNITIPYSTEHKGLSGCVIAWIVVGVIVGVLALLYLCVFGVLAKLLGGVANAFMATGILCCLCACFCCRRNWKEGLHNIGSGILPFIEEKLGGKKDAEKGEALRSVRQKAKGRGDGADVQKEQTVDTSD